MAFINSKERILDIVLTQKGRQKLAQGRLNVKYYAFHDDEINYQAQYEHRITSGAVTSLDLSSGGTFTRSSLGSYFTGAPTDGSTSFMAWAAVNTRRLENRGGAEGVMLLMEGARTNLIAVGTAVRNLATGPGQGTNTASQALGPDGELQGALTINASTEYGQYSTYALGTSGSQYVGSVFVKAAGLTSHNGNFYDDLGTTAVTLSNPTRTLTSLWERIDATRIAEHTTLRMIGVSGLVSAGAVGPAVAVNAHQDCYQIELGRFPSSFISGAVTTRAADFLSYAVGQYPASFATTGYRFTFAPNFLPADIVSAAGFLIGGIDSAINQGVLLSYAVPGSPRVFVASALKQSGVFTWSARGQVITFEIRPSAGTITISGATTGNGVSSVGAWVMAGDTPMTIGYRWSFNDFHTFGRFGTTITAL